MYLKRQITLMGVPTIDEDHLVMNVSKHVFVLIDKDKKSFTYVHHCTF